MSIHVSASVLKSFLLIEIYCICIDLKLNVLIEILLQYNDAIYPAPAYSTISVSASRVKEIPSIELE